MGISAFFKKLTGKKEAVKTDPTPAIVETQPKVQAVVQPAPAPAPVKKVAEVKAAPAPAAKMTNVIPARPVAKAAAPAKATSPFALTGGPKNQSDWLLLQIGKTGRAFIAAADRNKLTVQNPQASEGYFVRHDMTAALLGYRLVLTAYHFHQDVPSLEALRIVRTAMTGMLHRAVDITIEKSGDKESRAHLLMTAEEQFKNTEKEVAEACFQLRGKSPEPFAGFYESLIPAFGHKDSAHALHGRFGAVLADLYTKIEAAMAARNHQITG